MRACLLLAVICTFLETGCALYVGQCSKGSPIDPERVARLEKGKSTLDDVLTLLGAPLEAHAHTDGYLLVYRAGALNAVSFSISAGNLTSMLDVTQTVSSILDNFSFTFNSTHRDQDRVIILFDRNWIVRGIGYRERIKDMPWL